MAVAQPRTEPSSSPSPVGSRPSSRSWSSDGAILTADVPVSVGSPWEIEFARSLGRIDVDTRELIHEVSQTEGFRMLETRSTRVLTLGELPLLDEDPFDRMLIAQAIRDRLTLVSRDEAVHAHQVDVTW